MGFEKSIELPKIKFAKGFWVWTSQAGKLDGCGYSALLMKENDSNTIIIVWFHKEKFV